MTTAPELQDAHDLSSGDYLADRIKKAYQKLGTDHFGEIESLYSPDVSFEDPSHAVQGKVALLEYFNSMFSNLDYCQFKFHQSITDGTDIFLSWTMLVRHPRLRSGDTIRVEGASYLKTRNGKIYYQRDYFDMGALVYEHVPLIGKIIARIKHRLGS